VAESLIVALVAGFAVLGIGIVVVLVLLVRAFSRRG
jgi:hypothetical protein